MLDLLKGWKGLGQFLLMLLLLAVVSVSLGGCADSSSTGSTVERKYDVTIKATNESEGDLIIYIPLQVDNEQEQLLAQETKNTAEVSPDITAALSKEGATGSAAKEGGKVALDGVKNLVKKLNNTNTDSDNPVDNSVKKVEPDIEPLPADLQVGEHEEG